MKHVERISGCWENRKEETTSKGKINVTDTLVAHVLITLMSLFQRSSLALIIIPKSPDERQSDGFASCESCKKH